MNRAMLFFLLALGGSQGGERLHGEDGAVWPRQVALVGAGASHAVLSPAGLHSRDPGVARIEGRNIVAVADGETEVETAGVTVRVEVRETRRPAPGDFENVVLPILTHSGCNRSDCHGAALGQGGFKLSLFGSEPEADYLALTRDLSGRRIDRAEPARSLFLRKPSRQLPHKGGRVLPEEDPGYRALLTWAERGFPWHEGNLELEEIEARGSDQLLVRATYSDGVARDVTHLAIFSSNDDAIAEVDKEGKITLKAPGQTSIMVRFGGRVAAVAAGRPYTEKAAARLPANNFIDEAIGARLQSLGLEPSGDCDDATFLRRAYLDLCGTLPTAEEVRAFLQSPDRDQVIDRLIERPEFDLYWGYRLGQIFELNSRRMGVEGARDFHAWLKERVRRPWEETARAIITAGGRSPPANFYRSTNDPKEMAENVGRMLLSSRWMCAQCHNHPFENLRRGDYYGLAAIFARVRQSEDGIVHSNRGEIVFPVTGKPAVPCFPGGVATVTEGDRRLAMADWVVAQKTFRQAFANRVWALLMGHGLVQPVDDFRASNPASHPELLEKLGAFQTILELVRAVARSAAYQRAGPIDANRLERRFYSYAYVKPLAAEVLVDAVAQATGIPHEYAERAAGTRAIALGDLAVASYTLDVCGRNRPGFSGSLAQEIHLLNGELIESKLKGVNPFLELGNARLVEELYLRSLSRFPSKLETARWLKLLEEGPRQEAAEDLLWALLNSWEFRTCH